MQIKRFLGNVAKMTLAIAALSVPAFAAADDYFPYHNGYFNNGCCVNNSCCGSECMPAPACNWGYNPPAYLQCANSCNPCGCEGFLDSLGFRADFLWWRPSTDCIALGEESFFDFLPTVGFETDTINRTEIRRHKFKYDPGFRIGVSHVCPCDCWDAALNWTHFHSRAHASGFSEDLPTGGTADTGSFTVFFPFWERVTELTPDFARSRWTLNMDLIDLEFGYKYYVCSCFELRPHLGLRGGRIDQTIRTFSEANRTDDFTTELFTPDVFTSFTKSRCDFVCIGPRLGVDIQLCLGCGVSLYGQAAGSLLFGRYERRAREELAIFEGVGTTATEDDFTYTAGGGSKRTSRASTDLAFGLKWDHCFNWCNRCHPVSVAILWEHHAFYDLTDFNFISNGFDFTPDGGTSGLFAGFGSCGGQDLTTQGLTVSLNVGF